MARIRSIKPEFWTDGVMVGLTLAARLFYIGTWNFACDRGHLADDAMGLKLKIMPADAVDVVEILAELVAGGRIERRRTSTGRTFLLIRRFADHQKVDPRWNSKCPYCAEESTPEPLPDSQNHTETHPNSGEAQRDSPELPEPRPRIGREGIGEVDTCPPAQPEDVPESKPRRPRRTYDDPTFLEFYNAYPRKEKKPNAFKAWEAALKRGADPAALVAAAKSFRDDPRRQAKDPQFTPHPATWLNAEQYNDQPAPPPQRAGGWWNN